MDGVRILTYILLLCCSPVFSVIPTLVRKSKNINGLGCLYVARDQPGLNPLDGRTSPKVQQLRMNATRNIRSRPTQLADDQKQMSETVEPRRSSSARERKITNHGSLLKRHLKSSPEPQNEFTDNKEHSTYFKDEDGISLTSVQQDNQTETFLQEDQLSYQSSLELDSQNGRHVAEYRKGNPQPNSARHFPLLRPLHPKGTRRNNQRRIPRVQVSLMVSTTYDDMKFQAGETLVDSKLLTDGFHTLRFDQIVVDMQHKLRVELDGQDIRFVPSKVRNYPISYYKVGEVWMKLQGPVTFVADNYCDGSTSEEEASPNNEKVSADREASSDGVNSENDISTQIDGSPNTEDASVRFPGDHSSQDQSPSKPKNVISNAIISDRTIVHTIILNSTIRNSNVSFSYINNTVLVNTKIDNSLLIVADISNSSIINSTLHNVTLHNCDLQNTRTTNLVYDEHTTLSASQNTTDILPDFSHSEQEIIFPEPEGSSTKSSSAGGMDTTMMIFGILGMTTLVLVIAGVIFLIARNAVKKKKEMLLVRSAVMGNVRSW